MTILETPRSAHVPPDAEWVARQSRASMGDATRPRVVLCGSFRRDPASLQMSLARLRERFEVLAPRSVSFVDLDVDFVRLPDEANQSTREIELRHLEAISEADFVWLHAPDGYVGTSASMEIGHANALGIPVFTDVDLDDEMLASMTLRVSSIDSVELVVNDTVKPGAGVDALQRYYRRTSERRGWGGESPRDTLLLMTEEFGELARAVRKSEGLARASEFVDTDVALELADVQLYLVHLANSLGIDLARAVTRKEQINDDRARLRVSA